MNQQRWAQGQRAAGRAGTGAIPAARLVRSGWGACTGGSLATG